MTSCLDPQADPLARARALGPAIAAVTDEIEARQDFPEPLITELHESGLFRLLLPRSLGGEEVEPWVYVAAIEEIARHDGSLGWNMFVANSSALIAPFIPFEAARTIYGDPRGLISWGPPNQHKLAAAPGGYRVTGEWHFSSGYRQATWIGAHGHVVEADGSLRRNRFGRPTVRTLLMPKAGRTPIHDWNTLGMRGTASEGYSCKDVFVPEAFSGTREDPTLRRDRGPLYAFTMQGLYACGVAAVALGHRARHARRLHRARRRQDAALSGPSRRQSRVQSDVARREADIGSARAWLVEVLSDVHGAPTRSSRSARPTAPACGWPARRPSTRPRRRRTGSTRPPAPRRSSSARRSSAASATSIRCRSRSRRAKRISRLSAASCSTATPTAAS